MWAFHYFYNFQYFSKFCQRLNETWLAAVWPSEKRATPDDILEEINRLFAKGNRPYQLRSTEIVQSIRVYRHTVYNYIKKLSKWGDVVRLPSDHFSFPDCEFREFNKHHEITSDPMISEWMDDLLIRKQDVLFAEIVKSYGNTL